MKWFTRCDYIYYCCICSSSALPGSGSIGIQESGLSLSYRNLLTAVHVNSILVRCSKYWCGALGN